MELKNSLISRILSIGLGVLIFAAFNFGLSAGMAFSLSVGFLAWLTVMLVSSKQERDRAVVVEGATRLDLDNTIKTGKKLTMGMRQASLRLMQLEVKKEIEDLCKIAESMFDMLKKDPKDLRVVKQFITYYLEPTHKIIVKYSELATARPMPADAIETLERTEKSMKSIRATFLQQKEKMLANDVIDLDTEIKVFETVSGNINTATSTKEKTNVTSNGFK